MRVFAISVTVSKMLRLVRPRCFPTFQHQNDYSKQLLSVLQQYLCGEYTRKTGLTDEHNF